MGVFDKLKKVLFDEEDIEVPISSDELPERQPKKVEEPKNNTPRVIDYHNDEEDTIKEIKVPEDDASDNRIRFPIDDFEDIGDIPSRSRVHDSYEEPEEYVPPKKDIIREERPKEYHRDLSSVKDRFQDIQRETPREKSVEKVQPKVAEVKDYKKIIENEEANGKKPFKVSPIISPVFGVLEKNYKPEEVTEKRQMISKINSGVKPRMFGPVSYNDRPLPEPHRLKPKEKTTLKDDLVELNSTVSEIINDTVSPAKVVEEEELDMPAYANSYESEEDKVIATENYDEITSGIEDEYLANNNIEDAFEPTSEFDKITEQDNNSTHSSLDNMIDDTGEIPTYESHISEDNEKEEDNENLEDTIETDLFHLIDSMYQSKDEDSEEEE